MSELLIYKASAGSGKTYRLVAEYLKLLIEKPQAYREILAVTFTNKATAEMKGRIIEKLYRLKNGYETDMLQTLKDETSRDEQFIKKQAESALSYILHDYSMFSISTIDSFVQRIIQNLLWELGQHGNNELVLDEMPYLEKAVDDFLDDITNHPELFEHVKKLIEGKLNEGKSPNIQKDLVSLGNMLFKERYKLLNTSERQVMHEKSTLDTLRVEVSRLVSEISKETKKRARTVLDIIVNSGINGINSTNYKTFFKSTGGVLKSIITLSELNQYTPIKLDDRDHQATTDITPWLTKKNIKELKGFVEQQLMPAYVDLYQYLIKNYRIYNTAIAINENLSTLYILNDLYLKLREKLSDEGVMLLSDSSSLLKEFVLQSDTPFIYEKIGTRYTSYMLDEFQDTSQLQWRNFEPLISDSLGSNGLSMVVGDVKQSIYRWRNSDWRIMSSIESNSQFSPRVKQLTTNHRSASTIVEFNNRFFAKMVEIDEPEISNSQNESGVNLKKLYSDINQQISKKQPTGYVEVAFIPPKTDESDDTFNNHIKNLLIDLKNRGYRAGDIAFLVRKNEQGRYLAELLLRLKSSESQLTDFIEIVSQDALTLNASAAVRFCIAALKIALNPSDTLATAQFSKELADIKAKNQLVDWTNVFLSDNSETIKWLSSIRFYPLGYMVEAIMEKYLPELKFKNISINDDESVNTSIKSHLPYLTMLHEQAINFSYRGTSSLSKFIEWYEQHGKNEKLVMAQTNNAINILTIHKSKGLEFPVIIFPFADLQNQQKPRGDIIWCKLPDTIPNDILRQYPIFPIKQKESLTHTYFDTDYTTEMLLKKIDDINLQYVAFTRAKDELYLIVLSNPDITSNSSDQTKNFANFLPNDSTFSPAKETTEQKTVYAYGIKENSHNNIIQDKNEEVSTVTHYPIYAMKGTIAKQLKADEASLETQSDIQHGIAMHAMLSKIITIDDLDKALDWAIQNGYITYEQRQNTLDNLKSTLTNEPYLSWFSNNWEVKNETSIVNTDGTIYRPDRVLTNNNQAIIIDFKFGKPSPKHENQIKQYVVLLQNMGFENVKGYLWYFQLDQYEEVNGR
ncbi:MAG TPA: hypothetical protein DDY04_05590 [Bacteroidales bacterium]|nr:hypothetical protein [Bacteroidales bacterium]